MTEHGDQRVCFALTSEVERRLLQLEVTPFFRLRDGNDDFTQPGNLFRLMNPEQQQRLFKNIAAAMAGVPENIVRRQLMHFQKADPHYAEGVAKALGMKNRAATD